MKFTQIIAAGLLVAGIGVSTEASAQRYDGYNREYRGDLDGRWDNRWDRRDDRRWDNRWDRRDRHWGRHDRGRHYGWRNNRDCRTIWRHGERYRICR